MRVAVGWMAGAVLMGALVATPAPARADRVVFELRPGAALPATAAAAVPVWNDGARPGTDARRTSGATAWPWRLDRARVHAIELADSTAAAALLAALVADPGIAWAERDRPRVACVWPGARRARPMPPGGAATATPGADPLLDDGRQWGLDNRGAAGPYGGALNADVHAREAWAMSRGAAEVRLAIADTGIDPAHPDLAGTLVDGTSRIVDGDDATLTAGEGAEDSLGHGTEVAGVMAARTGDGAHFDTLGIAGVCGGDGGANPGCRVIPVRICAGHSGVASTVDEARGIGWAVDHGARVINLSFAATAPSTLERHAILDALARNALIVCAAGNRALDRPGLPMYPAALAADGLVLSVGASDAWDRRASWSSYGPWLDLVAPGVDIWTTALTYPNAFGAPPLRYGANSGTSFAAPFASGVAGLMLALRPELDAADLAPLMRANADPIEPPGSSGTPSTTGAGRLDAWGTLADLAPDRALVHGVAPARVVAIAHDTLALAEAGQPAMDALGRRAAVARLTMRATVAIPDSLVRPVRAWVRVAHSSTLRDTTTLPWLAPWATVLALDSDSLVLGGTLYRIEDARLAPAELPDSAARWLPAPPESARIAYTIWGRVKPAPNATAGSGRPAALRAVPNPFAGVTLVTGPPDSRVELVDVQGRRVRALQLSRSGRVAWDGRDFAGRRLPAGLYLGRAPTGAPLRVVKLE